MSGFESDTAPPPEFVFTHGRASRLNGITGPGLTASYKVAASDTRVAKAASGQATRRLRPRRPAAVRTLRRCPGQHDIRAVCRTVHACGIRNSAV
jgi:hypothetical protein